jgi:Flp pilus assembly protein TadB
LDSEDEMTVSHNRPSDPQGDSDVPRPAGHLTGTQRLIAACLVFVVVIVVIVVTGSAQPVGTVVAALLGVLIWASTGSSGTTGRR